jgi:peptidoglycan LD-endopeptidase CwlK
VSNHHTNINPCLLCEEKLKQVHADLARWVRMLRGTNLDAHVSCGYRGKVEQEEAFATGHSRAHFGESAHNTLPSTAVDLFRLTFPKGASFDRTWYSEVLAPAAIGAGLVWGGTWKIISDLPHVELPGFVPFTVIK